MGWDLIYILIQVIQQNLSPYAVYASNIVIVRFIAEEDVGRCTKNYEGTRPEAFFQGYCRVRTTYYVLLCNLFCGVSLVFAVPEPEPDSPETKDGETGGES